MIERLKQAPYFPFIGWFFPLALSKDDPEATLHAKQGLVMAAGGIGLVLSLYLLSKMVPVQWRVVRLIIVLLIYAGYAAYFGLCFYAYRVMNDPQKKNLPYIKDLAQKIDI